MASDYWSREVGDVFRPDARPLELPACSHCGMPTESEWQPIETAPRDGTYVLVYDATIWERTRGVIAAYSHTPGSGWTGQDNEYCCPTHWMPLPAPPK